MVEVVVWRRGGVVVQDRIQDTTLLELLVSVLAGGEPLHELPGSGATSDPKDTKKY